MRDYDIIIKPKLSEKTYPITWEGYNSEKFQENYPTIEENNVIEINFPVQERLHICNG